MACYQYGNENVRMDGDTTNTHAPVATRTAGEQPPTYHAYHDPEGSARYSTTLVHVLANVMDRDVTDAHAALAERIDPQALDLLFPSDHASPGHVAFSVDGYRITAYDGGEIVVTPPVDPAPVPPSGPTW